MCYGVMVMSPYVLFNKSANLYKMNGLRKVFVCLIVSVDTMNLAILLFMGCGIIDDMIDVILKNIY
jgi:hypothetical protein